MRQVARVPEPMMMMMRWSAAIPQVRRTAPWQFANIAPAKRQQKQLAAGCCRQCLAPTEPPASRRGRPQVLHHLSAGTARTGATRFDPAAPSWRAKNPARAIPVGRISPTPQMESSADQGTSPTHGPCLGGPGGRGRCHRPSDYLLMRLAGDISHNTSAISATPGYWFRQSQGRRRAAMRNGRRR